MLVPSPNTSFRQNKFQIDSNNVALLIFSITGAMPEGITPENLINNIMDTLSDKHQKQSSGSFFTEEKSHSVSDQFNKLFGRQKPIHHILGGGKCRVNLIILF